MRPNSERYLVPRNIRMMLSWLFFAVVCFGFAAAPWIAVANNNIRVPDAFVLMFMMVWSAFPIALGIYLLCWAAYRIELSGELGRIFVRESWLIMNCKAEYSMDRVYLVRQWHYSKNRAEIRDVVYLRSAAGKYRLTDGTMCRNLPELLNWIGKATKVKVLDLRQRAPIDS